MRPRGLLFSSKRAALPPNPGHAPADANLRPARLGVQTRWRKFSITAAGWAAYESLRAHHKTPQTRCFFNAPGRASSFLRKGRLCRRTRHTPRLTGFLTPGRKSEIFTRGLRSALRERCTRIDDAIAYLTCPLTDASNSCAVDKYREFIIGNIPTLCDSIDSIDETSYENNSFTNALNPQPEKMHKMAHYANGNDLFTSCAKTTRAFRMADFGYCRPYSPAR